MLRDVGKHMLSANAICGINVSATWVEAARFLTKNGEKVGELGKEVSNMVSIVRDPSMTFKEADDLFAKYIGMKWIGKGANCVFPMATSFRKIK